MLFVAGKDLRNKVTTLTKVLSPKSLTTWMETILIEVTDKVAITANDMAACLTIFAESNQIQKGTTYVNGKLFANILKTLDEDVTVTADDTHLTIRSHNAEFKIATTNPTDFKTPNNKHDPKMKIEVSTLLRLISKVIFATEKDQFRAPFNCVLWEVKKDSLRLVATDGFKLAIDQAPVSCNEEHSFLLSTRNMSILADALKSTTSDSATLDFQLSLLSLRTNDMLTRLNFTESTFPDYRRVIPTSYQITVQTAKDPLLSALKRALLVDNSRVILNITSQLTLHTSSPNTKYTEALETEKQGPDLIVALNPKFLLETISHIDTQQVELAFNTNTSPVQIKSPTQDYPVYIVMPIRIVNNEEVPA